MVRAPSPHVLSVGVDRSLATPLPLQLAEQIRSRVRANQLAPGARLPSSRALASEISVARTVTQGAYDQLVAEGWLEPRRGSGTYVAALDLPNVRPPSRTPRRAAGSRPPLSLRPGEPWVSPRPSPAWRRAWREVAQAAPPATYPDPQGLPELRTAIAELIGRTRGLDCTPDRVVVTSGTSHGISLCLEAWGSSTGSTLAVEDPGHGATVAVAHAAGWRVRDVPVDRDGMDTRQLDTPFPGRSAGAVGAVCVTPSHQYPLGALMPVQRRSDLLSVARRRGMYVIEDDYDSEFRYDVAPLPALAQLDPENVVYLGTVSKTLGAGLRLGWLVAGPGLVGQIREQRAALHDHPPWPLQRAMLSLLRDGEWDRVVRANRRLYRERDEEVARRLARFGEMSGSSAGLHSTLLLEDGVAEDVVAEAAANSVEVSPLSDYCRSRADLTGLVIGYGRVGGDELSRALDVLEKALRRRSGRRPARTHPGR